MHTPPSPLLVVCLCAAWCGSCTAYRATYDAVAATFPDVRFDWVDVEDQSDLVDPVEVENFPTLLIAQGDLATFLGPITPQRETLQRLVRAQVEASHAPAVLADAEAQALVRRLRQALAA